MKNKTKIISATVVSSIMSLSLLGNTVFAASSTFKDLINTTIIGGILTPLVYLLIGLSVVIFIYGVFKFTIQDQEKSKQEGKDFMIWGIVGIFVMVSVWGLVSILTNTFKLDNSAINGIPTL
jgi:uncharacterized membrane protein YuzA (DUF378 family)